MNEHCSYIQEFKEVVNGIWGTYLDSTTGFVLLKKQILDAQKSLKQDVSTLDNILFFYGDGDPNEPSSIELYRCTQGELKARNSTEGDNFVFIGNMALISIYHYWEDCYREKIAQELGITKDKLKSDIIGDIRLLRISIVHHRGIALQEVENCKVLDWYKENDKIFISKNQLEGILILIYKYLNDLQNK